MNNLGNYLKELRIQNNLTQEELANKLFLSRQAISRWETGKSIPDYDILIKLSKLYNVNINTIMVGNKNSIQNNIKEIYNLIIKEKNKYKKTKYILISLIIILFTIFLTFFFLFNYNKTNVYEFYGNNGLVVCEKSFMFITPDIAYFKTCDFIFYDDSQDEMDSFLYYYITKEGDKQPIFGGGEIHTLLTDENLTDGIFGFHSISTIKENLYVDLKTKQGKELTIKLNPKQTYSNKFDIKNLYYRYGLKNGISHTVNSIF